jgi:LPXTG-site transpeptidase (sortase) family protein
MVSLLLRIVTNIVILSGLLLATFGLGGAIGKTVADISAPVPGEESLSSAQPRQEDYSLAQKRLDVIQAAVRATAPVPEENGFIPYRIPITNSGDAVGAVAPTALAGPEPGEAPAPARPPAIPDRIVIPQIGLDAPIVLSPIEWVKIEGITYEQWEAPKTFAAGWQEGSANPGQAGNFVLIGHHNIDGKVFGHLIDLKEGDVIAIFSGERLFGYYVSKVILLEEREASLTQRQENAMWIRPTADERLTLVTCWPPESNTHRLIIVAQPAK